MKNIEKVKEWLKRSKSNLAFAKADFSLSEILYEDRCFNAQQAAEKALKAYCIANGIIFPKTHDLTFLIELLEKSNLLLPDEIQSAKFLTEYAVETRYPGNYDPVTVAEYQSAVEVAEKLVRWIEQKLFSDKE